VLAPIAKRLLALYFLVIPLSWLVGLAAYHVVPMSLTGEVAAASETGIVAKLTLLLYIPTALFLYTPACLILEGKLMGTSRRHWFGLTCAVIGFIPTAAIMMLFGGGRELFSPTVRLFLTLFGVSGAVFGYAYTIVTDIAESSE